MNASRVGSGGGEISVGGGSFLNGVSWGFQVVSVCVGLLGRGGVKGGVVVGGGVHWGGHKLFHVLGHNVQQVFGGGVRGLSGGVEESSRGVGVVFRGEDVPVGGFGFGT